MPAITNPPSFASGASGCVAAQTTTDEVDLAPEHAWQVHHTGYSHDGSTPCTAPVWLTFNEASGGTTPALRRFLLPPGQCVIIGQGTQNLHFVLGGGTVTAILNLYSQKDTAQ